MSSTIENFADLFNESLSITKIQPGSLVRATVVSVDEDWVTVNAGLKSEAIIPVHEFVNDAGEFNIVAGMEVDVVVDMLENGFGETLLSRERAKRVETWNELVVANERNESIIGVITGKVKGGFTVEIKNVRAFLPGSLVDVRPVRDLSHLEGKPLEFKVIKVDQKRNNIVVSRRAVLETDTSSERAELLGALQEGQEVKGVVKNLTEYGAFIDLGGLDGLLHITDMSWKRVKHPSEIVTVGDEISVVILKFDRERNRVSLGLKQLAGDPWTEITRRYPIKSRLKGKVTNITDYGCFVEIDSGVEGLVHVSEMDWTNKNVHPSKIVQVGEEVEVMVLDIDEERRRISLGVKQCQSNPWGAFAEEHAKNEKISGKIKSITDFGIFIGLEGGIDGLVHLSDISWNAVGEEALRQFKKGDEVHAVILSIDPERERISLGIKQLESDPFGEFTEELNKGSVVKGTVKSVEAAEAVIVLSEEVEATLRSTEMLPKTDDLTTVLTVGQEVESRILNLDRKNRLIQLTMKAVKETPVTAPVNEKSAAPTVAPVSTLGDLLKEQMGERSE